MTEYRRNKFGATASHSPNDGFEYSFVEKRMEQIGLLLRETQNLAQGATEIFSNFGLTKLGNYHVFDMLVGEKGKSPLIDFTTQDGMNGWLFLPSGYGEKAIVEHEVRTINSIFEQLRQKKVVILIGGRKSIQNIIFKTLGNKVAKQRMEDGSTGFYLKQTS